MTRKPVFFALTASAFLCASVTVPTADTAVYAQEAEKVSPARKIKRDEYTLKGRSASSLASSVTGYRTIDGTGNNEFDPDLGSSFEHLMRLSPVAYGDGISSLAGENRPSPRAISNIVIAQPANIPGRRSLSDYFWQWGQFIDHDFGLTEGTNPPEPANIMVPQGDPFFDPQNTGTQVIELNRSIFDPTTGTDFNNPREQENEITSWIDASNVYGSDDIRAAALRTNDGTGRLKTSAGNLLPFNTDGLANADSTDPSFFLAGDVRANEQLGLIAMHTLFVREHNRVADEISSDNPGMDGETVYQEARKYVGALMQVITYEEFLPILIGKSSLPKYRGYNPNINPDMANEFTTAAFRFGHSALNENLLRLDANGEEIAEGNVALRDAFFRPDRIINEGGIEPLLRGLAAQRAQRLDPFIVDSVRNFLFGPPGAGGFDLASLNIQRGRDHGLPGYNDVRRALGLTPVSSFSDITRDQDISDRLAEAYDSVEDIDLWVGGLSEDPFRDGQVGELFNRIITDQFVALRDGDRFWYERVFSGKALKDLRKTRLSEIITRNTSIGDELQKHVFMAK